MQIKFKRLHEDAILPTVGSDDAACFDLYALENVEFSGGEIKLVKTGWAVEPPDGYRVNIYVRSSTPLKKGFILANSVGIVDSDYRGELLIALMNVKVQKTNRLSADSELINELTENQILKGDKIAQIELVQSNPAKKFKIEEVNDISITARGDGGFGSTGN